MTASMTARPDHRTSSPAGSSGRASPASLRLRVKDDDSRKDKIARRWATALRSVLITFDQNVVEWADYISFLSRLLKCLQSGPSDLNEIPLKQQVSKRLAQCLGPTLPSGVHQKALLVYDYIFSRLGEKLSQDLNLYFPGFAPVVSFASLSVKPLVLDLYEKHVVKLQPGALRPALKSLILSLLPALEEENTEEFDRAIQIIAKLKLSSCEVISPQNAPTSAEAHQYFWQCLFLASITSSSRRPGALVYLSRHLPNFGLQSIGGANQDNRSIDEAVQCSAIANPEPGLLIRCFYTGLQDEHVLVQRGFLDLLCEKLPLNSSILQQLASKEDLEHLIMAAASVVLRRDMSLNRRLWTWFLGTASKTDDAGEDVGNLHSPRSDHTETPTTADDQLVQVEYLNKNSLSLIVNGLVRDFDTTSETPGVITRTLRICLALMDRWEIGNSLTPFIFVPAIKSVFKFHSMCDSKASRNEILRSANMFFDSIESPIIWKEVYKLIKEAFQSSDSAVRIENTEVIIFVSTKFNLRDEEMQDFHLPVAATYSLLRTRHLIDAHKLSDIELESSIARGLRMALILTQQITTTVRKSDSLPAELNAEFASDPDSFLNSIDSARQSSNSKEETKFSFQCIGNVLLQTACDIVAEVLSTNSILGHGSVELAVLILDTAFRKVPSIAPNTTAIFEKLTMPSLHTNITGYFGESFAVELARLSVLEVLFSAQYGRLKLQDDVLRSMITPLVSSIWRFLNRSNPRHHVEASKALWRLHAICKGSDLVESCIVRLGNDALTATSHERDRLQYVYSFTIFWQQSQGQPDIARHRRLQVTKVQNTLIPSKIQLLARPLFLVLDRLLGQEDTATVFIAHWLEQLPELSTVLNVVLAHTLKLTMSLTTAQPDLTHSLEDAPSHERPDLQSCVYVLKILNEVLSIGKQTLHVAIRDGPIDDFRQQMMTKLEIIIDTCTRIQSGCDRVLYPDADEKLTLKKLALHILDSTLPLLSAEMIIRLKVDIELLQELHKCVLQGQRMIQIALTKSIVNALKLRIDAFNLLHHLEVEDPLNEKPNIAAQAANGRDRSGQSSGTELQFSLPPQLLDCIVSVFSQDASSPVIDCWYAFLQQLLPLYGSEIFQIILPLSECFCSVLLTMLKDLKIAFTSDKVSHASTGEAAMIQVLNALERSLEIAHGTLAEMIGHSTEEKHEPPATSFFGMVSVISSEGSKARSPSDNNRLTVLLCFKDAMKVCFNIWALDELSMVSNGEESTSAASLKFTTLRLRNRTRRIAEHLFQAQDLECMETLVSLWHDFMLSDDQLGCSKVLGFISTIEAARPKVALPAVFNALYSRTHPTALDPDRRSSLTSSLSELTLAEFLVTYIRSLEDDAMEEIWQNCITFLRDILASPLNHRQVLIQLLEFMVELGAKIDKTNFGEQRKMRKELGDLFIKLMSAIATIKPAGFSHDGLLSTDITISSQETPGHRYSNLLKLGSADAITTLAGIIPRLPTTLLEHDRLSSVASQVSMQMLSPILKSKAFPENVDKATCDLLQAIGLIPEASKIFKKDVSESFNDPKFFSLRKSLVDVWLSMLWQWAIGDKERLPELYGRLTTPTSAGVMFGVGASSARLEADRRTQTTLRRIATLLIAAPQDAFAVNLPGLLEKLVELLNANSTSSPSSATRAEVYMVFRALAIRTSPTHLNPLWPLLNSEISAALVDSFVNEEQESLSPEGLLQLCKLMDTLLVLNYDDFQLQEWLWITDSADSVYRPEYTQATALVDLLAEELGEQNLEEPSTRYVASFGRNRKPLIKHETTKTIASQDYTEHIFKPFFNQLSIASFESTYSLETADIESCVQELVEDLFDDSALI